MNSNEKAAKGQGNDNQNENKKGKPRWANTFKGETQEMNGNVFQLQSEHGRKGQFDDTLEALQRYAAKFYPKDSVFLLPIFTKLERPVLSQPEKPEPKIKTEGDTGADTDEWDKILFTESVKMYLKNKERTEATLTSLFGVVWGQCSRLMQNRCRSHKDFKKIEEEYDVVELLKIIKAISHKFETHTCIWDALSQAKRRFYAYKQGDHEPNSIHVKNLKNLASVVEHYGGKLFEDKILEETIMKEAKLKGESITTDDCKGRVHWN